MAMCAVSHFIMDEVVTFLSFSLVSLPDSHLSGVQIKLKSHESGTVIFKNGSHQPQGEMSCVRQEKGELPCNKAPSVT